MSTVTIVGRPNVGKSTLFNKLIGQRKAIVHDTPGVTRDWKEGVCSVFGVRFRVTDTAGFQEVKRGNDDPLAAAMAAFTERQVRTADIVLMTVDGRAGLTREDEHIARWLRPLRQGRPVLLAVTKCEGDVGADCAIEACRLGFGSPVQVSAEHNVGLGELAREIVPHLREEEELEEGSQHISLAVVGQPNVGKSTLVNSLLDKQRMLVGPVAGLTRESVEVN